MRNKLIFLVIAVLLIAGVGYYYKSSSIAGLQTYSNDKYGFQFEYPSDWRFAMERENAVAFNTSFKEGDRGLYFWVSSGEKPEKSWVEFRKSILAKDTIILNQGKSNEILESFSYQQGEETGLNIFYFTEAWYLNGIHASFSRGPDNFYDDSDLTKNRAEFIENSSHTLEQMRTVITTFKLIK